MNTGHLTDGQIADLKARNPVVEIARRYVSLRSRGGKVIGPCPICSRDPASRNAARFEIKDDGWVCAVCADGGDVIRLVERIEGLDFRGAVEWLGGAQRIDPAVAAARERERAEREAKRKAETDAYRQRERRRLYDIWKRAAEPWDTPVQGYLRRRGLDVPEWPMWQARLRCVQDMPYFHGEQLDETGRKQPRIIHRGPAMVAPIVRGGKFSGLHFTWIDLTKPNGKAEIHDPETGEALPAKKVRGSKAAGVIQLMPAPVPLQLILGEGTETVLSVWWALKGTGRNLGATSFCSAVDLGNLGGPAIDLIAHPTLTTEIGRPRRVPGPIPDMDEPGIAVPASVTDVVLLGDGDSDRFITELAMIRASKRFARAGRTVRVAWATPGRDFNDMLREAAA